MVFCFIATKIYLCRLFHLRKSKVFSLISLIKTFFQLTSKQCFNFKVRSFVRLKILWEVSSGSESIKLQDWQTENSNSGSGSFWERYPVGSWFYTSVFRNFPATVPESVRICGFKRNSSNLDRARKMRDSVLLNSWDSFSVTLLSISSETWVMSSSVISGTDVCVLCLTVPGMFTCFPWNSCWLSLFFLVLPSLVGKNVQKWKRLKYSFKFESILECNKNLASSF